MTKKSLDAQEKIDRIVVEELQSSFDTTLRCRPLDFELLDAIKTVLKYYMVDSDFQEWYTEACLKEMTALAQLNGEYNES